MWASYPVFFDTVDAKSGSEKITAFLSRPEGKKAPAVIVIHDWWGLTDHIRHVCNVLASEGLVAMAPDLYNGRLYLTTEAASKAERAVDNSRVLSELDVCFNYLRKANYVQDKIGVIGFCMGGTISFLFGCRNRELAACVVYYGDNPSPIDLVKELPCPFLGIYGTHDSWISPKKVMEVETALKKHGKKYEIYSYDASHAFLNNTREDYNAEAAAGAWQKTSDFLDRELMS